MRVIISAAGTGGHIYPAIAIINKIKELDPEAEFLYIGTTDRMEKDIIPRLGIRYVGLEISGITKNVVKSLRSLRRMIKGISVCKRIMREFRPDVVIGVGGYVTVPVIYSAKKLGYPTMLHEQNSIPGRANRFLARYADKICCSMKESMKYFPKEKAVLTGNPRSEEICSIKPKSKSALGLPLKKRIVLITTGSLGSSAVNDKIFSELDKFSSKNYQVLIVTGEAMFDKYKSSDVPSNVELYPYIANMGDYLHNVSLIVSRAGATIIAEITGLGLPSILIPSPYVANNHQFINAKSLVDNGASVLIAEKDLTMDRLVKEIDNIFNDEKKYLSLKKNARKMGIVDSASRIYNVILEITK